MEADRKVSESIRLGTILAITGGFMDAYSYIVRIPQLMMLLDNEQIVV